MTHWPVHWKVRPYVITHGRTRTRQPLLVHTLVSVGHYDPLFAASLLPEARRLYEQAQAHTRAYASCSVAELSASCGMSLGVTRVLLADLATNHRLVIHPDGRSSHDLDLLERIRDGLRKFV